MEELHRDFEDMRREIEEIEACKQDYVEAKRRYEKLLESAPDALLYVDAEGTVTLHNPQAERLFGYEQEELRGRKLEVLIPERFRTRHRKHLIEFFANPRVRPMGSGLNIVGLRKDGTEFPADISLSLLESEGRTLTVAAVRDISERKRAEEKIELSYHTQRVISGVLKISLQDIPFDDQLERSLDLLLSIPGLALESKGFIYLLEDEPGVLVLRAPRQTELQPPPCEKISFGKCLCGTAAATCTLVHADCIDDRHEVRYRDDYPHGHYCVPIVSGGRALGVINLFLKEGHGRKEDEELFLTAVADTLAGVVKRYQTDLERRRLTERLAEAEKFSALGRIVANIADEMRNPLTSVGGFARRLVKKLGDGTAERGYSQTIVTEVDRLEDILKKVIALARGERPHLKPADLRTVVEDAVRSFEDKFRTQSVRCEMQLADLPPVGVDTPQLKMALSNIMTNAMEAMPVGGRLAIDMAEESVRGKRYAVIKIRDTGSGISPEKQEMVFEPFFTTKLAPKGTGLGLPIARKIMDDHGGFARLESSPGEGTTVSLFFPIDREG